MSLIHDIFGVDLPPVSTMQWTTTHVWACPSCGAFLQADGIHSCHVYPYPVPNGIAFTTNTTNLPLPKPRRRKYKRRDV